MRDSGAHLKAHEQPGLRCQGLLIWPTPASLVFKKLLIILHFLTNFFVHQGCIGGNLMRTASTKRTRTAGVGA